MAEFFKSYDHYRDRIWKSFCKDFPNNIYTEEQKQEYIDSVVNSRRLTIIFDALREGMNDKSN